MAVTDSSAPSPLYLIMSFVGLLYISIEQCDLILHFCDLGKVGKYRKHRKSYERNEK